ncbi:reverse transcriptase domain-containing protein [Tanacetum coccineum]
MPPRMMTRSARRQTAAPRGRRTGGRTGRGGGRTREPTGRVSGRTGDQDGQGSDQGIGENGGIDEVPDFSTIIVAKAGIRVKMAGAGHIAYTDRFHELARLVPHLVTPENKWIKRNGSLRKFTKKRGNGRELSRDRNVRDDNKRSRTGRAFSTVTNPIRKEYTGTAPKVGPRMVTPVNARNPTTTRWACFKCGGTDHYKATCPRLNRAPRPRGNRQNQTMAIEGGQGRGKNSNQTCGGAFMMGAEEAR